MVRRITIKNKSSVELGIMLEPWTDREDIKPGGAVVVEGEFSDEELTIDFGDDAFISIWCPPGSVFHNS
jgi:hypothetical protein